MHSLPSRDREEAYEQMIGEHSLVIPTKRFQARSITHRPLWRLQSIRRRGRKRFIVARLLKDGVIHVAQDSSTQPTCCLDARARARVFDHYYNLRQPNQLA